MASNNTTPISQSEINKAVWDACDTFRGVISADTVTLPNLRHLINRIKLPD